MTRKLRLQDGSEVPILERPEELDLSAAEYSFADARIQCTTDDIRRINVDGQPLRLSPKYSRVIHLLGRHPRIVIGRDLMIDQLWGLDNESTESLDNNLRVTMQQVRTAINRVSLQPPEAPALGHPKKGAILNIYNLGYYAALHITEGERFR